jgi:NAD(P)H dehydrogenase (quinone)
MPNSKPTVLITGATGQVGGDTLRRLSSDATITLVAAVRTPAQAAAFAVQGIRSVLLDFDRTETLAPALVGIDRVLLVTGYTVDMLRQSKAFLDQAHTAGVRHVVHLGACGPDDTPWPTGPGTNWWSATLSGAASRSRTCAPKPSCKTCSATAARR